MTDRTLKGVIAAVPTPITAAGEPDLERFMQHAEWVLANGANGLNVLGTTGEANSFSADQREAVMEAASTLGGERLMVGTGTPDLATSARLTAKAYDFGYAGALVLPPYYYKGMTDEGLFKWFERLIAMTSSTPILIYLYNFPQMTALPFSPGLLADLAKNFPERIAGAKDSSGDLEYAERVARIDNFDVFPSSETALAQAQRKGFAGCISASVSVTAPISQKLWHDQDNKDLLERVSKARAGIAAQPLIPGIKYLMGQLHGDAEFERFLPPHLPLTAEQNAALPSLDQMR